MKKEIAKGKMSRDVDGEWMVKGKMGRDVDGDTEKGTRGLK
jgi:hypothetical protein